MADMNSTDSDHRLLPHPHVVREPGGVGQGHWAGAPGVAYSRGDRAFYLTYRIRRPRGVAPDRGGEARIARSTDLKHFEDIWSVTKDRYDSVSIERSAIKQGRDGAWRYFTSFVDPVDGRWCVSVLKSSDPRRLDASSAQRLYTAAPLGLEGVKDPWIFEDDGVYYMLLSVATPTPRTREESHATLDIFNTGECVSASGLARSHDLDTWEWLGVVFAPASSGWDSYCRRINSIVRHDGQYLALYDGSASHLENYEEKTGVAISRDLRSWETLTAGGPALTSPHASGSLRYLDAVAVEDDLWAFYEMARADGAHDLRVARMDIDQLLVGLRPGTG
jgi:hypothetical protein